MLQGHEACSTTLYFINTVVGPICLQLLFYNFFSYCDKMKIR